MANKIDAEQKTLIKYTFFAMLIILTLLFLWIISPFFNAIIIGLIISYICYPIYAAIFKKFPHKNIVAWIMIVLILLIIIVPSILLMPSMMDQAYSSYNLLTTQLDNAKVKVVNCTDCGVMMKTMSAIMTEANIEEAKLAVRGVITNFTDAHYILSTGTNFLSYIPFLLLSIFLFFLVVFFTLRDGQSFFRNLLDLVPMKKQHREEIAKQVKDTMDAVIFGSIFTAIVQGVFCGLGFYMFGLKAPVFWGVMTGIFAFVPLIGTGIIWGPVSLYLIYEGMFNPAMPFSLKGVFFLMYCAVFVGFIDNIIKPIIIGNKAKIHPIFVFIGVFGGLFTLGPIGLFVGPIIVALLIVLIKIYRAEKDYFIPG